MTKPEKIIVRGGVVWVPMGAKLENIAVYHATIVCPTYKQERKKAALREACVKNVTMQGCRYVTLDDFAPAEYSKLLEKLNVFASAGGCGESKG